MSFAAVARHVATLEHAQLVSRRIQGREHWISMTAEGLRDAEAWIAEQADAWSARADGRFVALDRPERLSFTWRTGDEPESIVTVLLAAHGDGEALMTIIHSRQPPPLVPSYQSGWTSVAQRLGEHLRG